MRRPILLIATMLLTAGLPRSAAAQNSDVTRSGAHFSIGLGAGSVSASCPGCDVDFFSDRITGVSGVLQLGFFATPRLAIAGEFVGWMRNDDPIYRRVAGLGIAVIGYPGATNGFFVKATVGGLRAIVEDDYIRAQTDAFMVTTGIGYDLPLGPKVALTAYANYVRSFGGSTWFNGLSSDVVVTPNALQLGVGLTVH